MVKGSGQSAELNTDHRDIDPSFGAGDGAFVIAHQATVVHQPTESAFDHPAPWQDFKALNRIGALDYFDRQLGAQRFNPVSKGVPGITAIDPQEAEPHKPAQHPAQDRLAAVALGGVGWGDDYAQDQAQGIYQQMTLAAFDPLARVETHRAAMTGGLDALTVQYRGRGLTLLALSFPHQNPQRIIEGRPKITELPAAENTIDRLPWWEISGQIPPLDACFDDIEHGIDHLAQVGARPAPFGRFRQHRFEIFPLGVGEAGSVLGVFHRLNGSFRLKIAALSQHHCQQLIAISCAFGQPIQSNSPENQPVFNF